MLFLDCELLLLFREALIWLKTKRTNESIH